MQLWRLERKHFVVALRTRHQLPDSSPMSFLLWGLEKAMEQAAQFGGVQPRGLPLPVSPSILKTAVPNPPCFFQAFIPTLGDTEVLLASLRTRQGFPKEMTGSPGMDALLTPAPSQESSPKPQGCCSSRRHCSE